MKIAIAGSVATDHLMTYPGRFTDSLVVGSLDTISLSFLVDDLVVRRGGCAANICFGLGSVGLELPTRRDENSNTPTGAATKAFRA